jgi:predicted DNA-binding protein
MKKTYNIRIDTGDLERLGKLSNQMTREGGKYVSKAEIIRTEISRRIREEENKGRTL